MRTYYYFKIFNNIKSEHEPNQLAYLELQSLFGQIEPIRNFVDFLVRPPLSYFLADPIRIQDIITMELPYGRIQGYYGEKLNLGEVTNLVRRLAYTREIFLIFESQKHPKDLLRIIFPEGVINKNVQFFKNDNLNLFRFITNQYFLEKSQYISKISNTKKDVDKNIEILFSYLTNNFLKIPSSSTLYYEKKLADYFTIREEKSLYLNHYMHPYKGKFHPKMVRSLINYVLPNEKGIILDNFAGSGTSLLEACYLGINSFGVEINPLSVLMANVKCQSNSINLPNLAEKRDFFIKKIREKIENLEKNSTVSKIQQNRKFSKMYEEIDYISNYLGSIHGLNKQEKLIEKIILAKDIIKEFNEKQLRDFFLLTLSGTISDILRRTKKSFILAFNNRITDLFLRIYLFQKMNEILRINLGKGIT
ncbi:MAG: DNA methyltransferase, partial [Asgard group archaeon]|nr:DNA methyltransferase [Asgard group archaeon]